jgi:enterochelin esterase-like enzyme
MSRIALPTLAVLALLAGACRVPLSEGLTSQAGRSGDDHRAIDYRVYLPPGYESEPEARYPLLVWFHGGGENEDGWGRRGRIGEIAHARMASGNLQKFIVLAPSAGSFTPIWFGYERRLIEQTIPEVQAAYRCNGTVVAFGHSMGGLSLLMVGLRNPDAFDAMCVASPFVFDTHAWETPERRRWFEQKFGSGGFVSRYRQNQRKYFDEFDQFARWDPITLIRTRGGSVRLPPLLLTSGDRDNLGLWPHNLHLHELMLAHGIDHDWLPQPGVGHGTVEEPALMRWLDLQARSASAAR